MLEGPKGFAGTITFRVEDGTWPERQKMYEGGKLLGQHREYSSCCRASLWKEKYLVMAGVMNELRLEFGSRDVLFESFSSQDFHQFKRRNLVSPRVQAHLCSIERALPELCQF
jgi:hypothetical protein